MGKITHGGKVETYEEFIVLHNAHSQSYKPKRVKVISTISSILLLCYCCATKVVIIFLY